MKLAEGRRATGVLASPGIETKIEGFQFKRAMLETPERTSSKSTHTPQICSCIRDSPFERHSERSWVTPVCQAKEENLAQNRVEETETQFHNKPLTSAATPDGEGTHNPRHGSEE